MAFSRTKDHRDPAVGIAGSAGAVATPLQSMVSVTALISIRHHCTTVPTTATTTRAWQLEIARAAWKVFSSV